MELFILADGNYYKGGNEAKRDYYLTNDALRCEEIASEVDKDWYEASDRGEWFDYREEVEARCEKHAGLVFQKIETSEIYYY